MGSDTHSLVPKAKDKPLRQKGSELFTAILDNNQNHIYSGLAIRRLGQNSVFPLSIPASVGKGKKM